MWGGRLLSNYLKHLDLWKVSLITWIKLVSSSSSGRSSNSSSSSSSSGGGGSTTTEH